MSSDVTQPPGTTITTPAQGGWINSGDITFEGQTSDAVLGVNWVLALPPLSVPVSSA